MIGGLTRDPVIFAITPSPSSALATSAETPSGSVYVANTPDKRAADNSMMQIKSNPYQRPTPETKSNKDPYREMT